MGSLLRHNRGRRQLVEGKYIRCLGWLLGRLNLSQSRSRSALRGTFSLQDSPCPSQEFGETLLLLLFLEGCTPSSWRPGRRHGSDGIRELLELNNTTYVRSEDGWNAVSSNRSAKAETVSYS